ncbi:hypothetical protein [Bifidobacterium fermentum]|uniref:Uncharacterized protein n=1 Tax=Bifidobacterium fermentum TaxID=3059035 RepID=A0AB39UCE0_9BIFI
MKYRKVTIFLGAFFTIAVAFGGVQTASAEEANITPVPTDEYVLSPTYTDPSGKTIDSSDGLTVYSGSIELTPSNSQVQLRAISRYSFGSSYVSSNERLQYWYDGVAYASGKKDYRNPSKPLALQRVVQTCFKYVRDGKDLIGWQCSNASLGPSFSPGKVVKKTIRDTLNPVAPKTTFRYSFKAV